MAEQTRRRTETRERLLAAALTLIRERSLESATVESVSELAGFTRGAFYSNFASMDDMLVALFEKRAEELIPAIGAVAPDGGDDSAQNRLVTGVAERLLAIPYDRDWFLLMRDVSAMAARRPEAKQPFVAFRRRLRERCGAILKEELEALGLRPTLDLDALGTAVIAVFEAWLEREYLDGVDHGTAGAQCATTVTALLLGTTEPLDAGDDSGASGGGAPDDEND